MKRLCIVDRNVTNLMLYNKFVVEKAIELEEILSLDIMEEEKEVFKKAYDTKEFEGTSFLDNPKIVIFWNKKIVRQSHYCVFNYLSQHLINPSPIAKQVYDDMVPTGLTAVITTGDFTKRVIAGIRPMNVKAGKGFLGAPGVFMKMNINQVGRDIDLYSILRAQVEFCVGHEIGLFPNEFSYDFRLTCLNDYPEFRQVEVGVVGETKLKFRDIKFRSEHNPFEPDKHIHDFLLGLKEEEVINFWDNNGPIATAHGAMLLEAFGLSPETKIPMLDSDLANPHIPFEGNIREFLVEK